MRDGTRHKVHLASTIQATVTVTAGVIPGHPVVDFSRRWDWKRTTPHNAAPTAEELIQFHQDLDEAHTYARELQNPGFVKWVKLEWIWL